MSQQATTKQTPTGDRHLDKHVVRIPRELHRNFQLAAAGRGQRIVEIYRQAWQAFERQEGAALHNLQPKGN